MKNLNPIEVEISSDAGGYYVEWYQEGVDGPETVAGETLAARWYGTRADCLVRAKKRPPKLRPIFPGDLYGDAGSYTRNASTCVGGEDQ